LVQLSLDITDEERRAARDAIKSLDRFLRELWAARQNDKKLINVLKKNQNNVDSSSLFEIRHLLRRFQKEVKDRYVQLIFNFAGKKDDNFNVLSEGYIHSLSLLEKDTTTRQMKSSLQDAMQQLTEFVQDFIELFEDFNDPEQVNKILKFSDNIDDVVRSIENIIDTQIKVHFERNIIKRKRASEIQKDIIKRSRLINMLGS
jgi:hemerythrin superfamily protein